MNMIPSLLLVAVLAAFSPQQLSVKELRNAPTMIVVDNRALHLAAYPWRDFAPGSMGGDGTPLMVAFKVTSDDKQALPNGLRMEQAWVLFGEEVWEVSNLRGGNASQDQPKDTWIKCANSPVCEVTARGGPRWGPGVYVDVVLRLSDKEGKQFLLQSPHQYVRRTD